MNHWKLWTVLIKPLKKKIPKINPVKVAEKKNEIKRQYGNYQKKSEQCKIRERLRKS